LPRQTDVKIGNLFKINGLLLDASFFFFEKMERSSRSRRVVSLTKAIEALKFYRFYLVDGKISKIRALSPPTQPESTTKRKSLRRAALPAFQAGVGDATPE
jgi:hypothetical protein